MQVVVLLRKRLPRISHNRFVRNLHRDREIVKRIEKTKREAEVDLYAEREERDRKERLARKKVIPFERGGRDLCMVTSGA